MVAAVAAAVVVVAVEVVAVAGGGEGVVEAVGASLSSVACLPATVSRGRSAQVCCSYMVQLLLDPRQK